MITLKINWNIFCLKIAKKKIKSLKQKCKFITKSSLNILYKFWFFKNQMNLIVCSLVHFVFVQKGTEDLTTTPHGDWTLIHTRSSHDFDWIAFLYSKGIKQYITSVVRKSDRIIAAHLQGIPKCL